MCSNLYRNKNPHPPFEKIDPLLPVLAEFLQSNDDRIIRDAYRAPSYVTDDDSDKIQMVIDSRAVPTLMALFDLEAMATVTPALHTVGKIVTGNDLQTDAVLLQHKKHSILKEAAWTSNIAAGNPDQVGALIDSKTPSLMCHVITNGDCKTQKEAAWVVTNITTGATPEQLIYLAENFYCDLLDSPDPRIIHVVISGMENLFKMAEQINGVESLCMLIEEFGALAKLKALQGNDNKQAICKQAFWIVERYFSDGTTTDEGLTPAEENDEIQFNAAPTDQNGFIF